MLFYQRQGIPKDIFSSGFYNKMCIYVCSMQPICSAVSSFLICWSGGGM